MPNWAATKYVLVGSKTNCRNAYEQLKKAANSSNGWLGNLNAFLYPEHITLENIEKDQYVAPLPVWDCRGWIQDVYLTMGCEDAHVEMWVEDAWGAHWEIVDLFANMHNLTMNYCCEELGCEVYESYDPCNVISDSQQVLMYEEDEYGNSGEYEYLEFNNIFREDMENSELWNFHDGAFMKWCKEHDKIPNPDNMEELLGDFNDDTGLYIFYLPEYIIGDLDHPVLPEYNGCVEKYWEKQKSTE